MERPEDIGGRLRALRYVLGFEYSSAAFARTVGLSAQVWNNYELGKRRISLDEALKVCARTGVTLDWIYRGIDDAMPYQLASKLRARKKA